MKPKNPKMHENVPEYTPDPEYDFTKASSATDCTGAVPRPPETEAELDSYLEVYNFLPQCVIAKEALPDTEKQKEICK